MATLTTTAAPSATAGIRQLSLALPVVEARSSCPRSQEIKAGFRWRQLGTSSLGLRMLCRSRRGGEPEPARDSASGLSQMERQGAEEGAGGDVGYLLKLGVGTFAGAAVIKYGSVVFPEITRPNLTQALLMVSLPVVVAIVLLFINQTLSSDED